MERTDDAVPEREMPPEVPEVDREIKLYRIQAGGLGALTLIMLLSALGVLGEARASADGSAPGIEVWVEYPSRMRLSQRSEILVSVRNRSSAPARGLHVQFGGAFGSALRIEHSAPARSGSDAIALTVLGAGEASESAVIIRAERPGRYTATVTVGEGGDAVDLSLPIWVLP